MVYHVESDSGLHAVTWEGGAGKGAYRWKEGGKESSLVP